MSKQVMHPINDLDVLTFIVQQLSEEVKVIKVRFGI